MPIGEVPQTPLARTIASHRSRAKIPDKLRHNRQIRERGWVVAYALQFEAEAWGLRFWPPEVRVPAICTDALRAMPLATSRTLNCHGPGRAL